MDLSDLETRRKVENSLNEDQYACLNTILKKQVGQFNEHVYNRKQIPTLVLKSFILGRFDSYY